MYEPRLEPVVNGYERELCQRTNMKLLSNTRNIIGEDRSQFSVLYLQRISIVVN